MDESLITPELAGRVGIRSDRISIAVTPALVRQTWEMLDRSPDERPDEVPPAVLLMPDAGREVSPLPGLPANSLVTGEDWEMRRAIRVGETLTAANRLADLAERFGGRLGHMLSVRHEWVFEDMDDAPVAVTRRSMAYYRSEGLRTREEHPGEPYRPPPLAPVEGVDPRSASEGDQIRARVFTPTLEQVRRYCDITGNRTPIFLDAEAARAAGLPGTIIPGPLKLSLLADAVLAWAGAGALLESLRASYRRPDVPGVPLLIGGTVTRVDGTESGRRLHCELWFHNQSGERSVAGAAIVRLGPAQ
ncbi:MAG: MaoC family dehydratase N-terminal domain-containing protein [Dehalococcoidia bacterium]